MNAPGPLLGLAIRWSGRHLPALEESAYQRWIDGATELARDRHGARTLRTADGGRVIKEFRQARILTSATWSPYALRFAEACALAARRGIAAPDVEGAWRLPSRALHVVAYGWREGADLRDALGAGGADALLERFGGFLARMHDAGGDFRAGHLGNYLVGADGSLSVLDCVDLRWRERPLDGQQRARAIFRACTRDRSDGELLERHAAAFLRGYFGASRMSDADRVTTWSCLPGALSERDGWTAPPPRLPD